MTAMKWQKHATWAMLSAGGLLAKKHGLVVTSEKVGEKRILLHQSVSYIEPPSASRRLPRRLFSL